MLGPLPAFATYVHEGVRTGFEVVCFREPTHDPGATLVIEGGTSAIEDGRPWTVHYQITVDADWRTTRATAVAASLSGRHELTVDVSDGRWWVDGTRRRDLDGCVDIDFEASVVTNTLAVHRIDLTSDAPVPVPAAFVRAGDLEVVRLEQTYRCSDLGTDRIVLDYTSTTFDFSCELIVDPSGLVVSYPGLGRRDA